jgi:hypothetical protein
MYQMKSKQIVITNVKQICALRVGGEGVKLNKIIKSYYLCSYFPIILVIDSIRVGHKKDGLETDKQKRKIKQPYNLQ